MSCLIGLGVWFGSGSFWYGFSAWLGSWAILSLLSRGNHANNRVARELRRFNDRNQNKD